MLKLQIPRYVQGEFGKQTTVEKNEGAAVFEWEKIQGGIQQHEMYILDTVDTAWQSGENWSKGNWQVSFEPWETQLLSSRRKRVDIFQACTVRVYQLWDDSEDLVLIARG